MLECKNKSKHINDHNKYNRLISSVEIKGWIEKTTSVFCHKGVAFTRLPHWKQFIYKYTHIYNYSAWRYWHTINTGRTLYDTLLERWAAHEVKFVFMQACLRGHFSNLWNRGRDPKQTLSEFLGWRIRSTVQSYQNGWKLRGKITERREPQKFVATFTYGFPSSH